MGLKFRRKIKIADGISINLSKTGFSSVSIGKPGSMFNVGKKGTKTTLGIPGSGLSYTLTPNRRRERNTIKEPTHSEESFGQMRQRYTEENFKKFLSSQYLMNNINKEKFFNYKKENVLNKLISQKTIGEIYQPNWLQLVKNVESTEVLLGTNQDFFFGENVDNRIIIKDDEVYVNIPKQEDYKMPINIYVTFLFSLICLISSFAQSSVWFGVFGFVGLTISMPIRANKIAWHRLKVFNEYVDKWKIEKMEYISVANEVFEKTKTRAEKLDTFALNELFQLCFKDIDVPFVSSDIYLDRENKTIAVLTKFPNVEDIVADHRLNSNGLVSKKNKSDKTINSEYFECLVRYVLVISQIIHYGVSLNAVSVTVENQEGGVIAFINIDKGQIELFDSDRGIHEINILKIFDKFMPVIDIKKTDFSLKEICEYPQIDFSKLEHVFKVKTSDDDEEGLSEDLVA